MARRLTDVIGWVGANGKRIAVSIVGFALVAIGLVLLVLPGPGILVVLAGLAVLATQYAWARRALDEVKKRASGATKRLRRRQPEL
ncbi:MAG: PGPGW domain-containing protein [Actinomycetota bacterium]